MCVTINTMLCRNPYSFFALSFVHPKTWMRETQSRWSFFLPTLVEWHSAAHTQQQEGFFRCVASSYQGKCSSSRSSSGGDSLEKDSRRTDRAATTAMPPPTYRIGCYSPTSTQQCRVELTQRLSSIQVCYSLGFLCQSFTRLERVRISLFLILSFADFGNLFLLVAISLSTVDLQRVYFYCWIQLISIDSGIAHTHDEFSKHQKHLTAAIIKKGKEESGHIREKRHTSVPPVFAILLPTSLTIIISRWSFEQTTFLRAISHHDDHLLDYR